MKPLIFFFWFLLISTNLMAKELLISELEKSPLIIESRCNYFDFKLQMNYVICEMPFSSFRIIGIHNKHSHLVMHSTHLYIKGYNTGQCNEFKYTDTDKYIVLSNFKSTNFNFNFLGKTLFYGKAPPNAEYP